MDKKSSGFKIALWAVAIVFLVSQGGMAAPGLNLEIMPETETPSFLRVDIPPRLAEVEEIYEAPPKVDPNLVIHIQNAHGNYDAQVKIRDLLKYLYEKYNFRLFFVEGAIERLNPNYLRVFPENSHNIELADRLAREGKITGAEFFLVEAPHQVEAIGIEHADLYRANYDAFKEVHAGGSTAAAFISGADTRLNSAAAQVFNRDLRRLGTEWKRFEEGHRDFLPSVKRLAEDAAKYLDVQMDSLFAQAEWPQITRLLLLQSMEEDIDLEAGKAEKEEVIKFLRTARVSDKIVDAIKNLEENHIRMNRLSPEDERMENLPRYLIERLTVEAGPKGFHFKDFPQFSLYAGYHILKSEIDSRMLFEEIDILFEEVLNKVAVSNEERKLLSLFRDTEIVRKLFSLELTRDNWDDFQRRQNGLTPQGLFNRIAEVDGGSRVPGGQELDKVFEAAVRFYNLARQRETVFYYTIKKGMTSQAEEKSTLLTGGFHTAGVFERFREDEVNYGVLMPKIRGEINRENYERTMLDTHPAMFKSATLEQRPVLQSAEALAFSTYASAGRAEVEAVELDFGMQVLGASIGWNHESVQDGSLPGKDYYTAAQFVSAYNASPAAELRDMEIHPDVTGRFVYVFHNGKPVLAEGGYATIPIVPVRDATGNTVLILGTAGSSTDEAPQPSVPLRAADEDAAPIDLPPNVYGITTSEIPPAPAPAAESESARSQLKAAQAARTSAFVNLDTVATPPPVLGPGIMTLISQIDLSVVPAEEGEAQRFVSLVSAVVSGGFPGPELSPEPAISIMSEILTLADDDRPEVEKRIDIVRAQADKFFSSEASSVLFDVRAKPFDASNREELLGLATHLAVNPNLDRILVLGSDDAEARKNFEANVRAELDKLGQETGLNTAKLYDRLMFITARRADVSDAVGKFYQKRYQKKGLPSMPYVVLAQDSLAMDDFELPPNGVVIASSVDEYRETQAYIAGAAAQRLKPGKDLDTGDFEGVLLKQDTVTGLARYEMQQGPLSAFHLRMTAIVEMFKAALQLERSA